MTDEVRAYNNGFIIGLTMGGLTVVKEGGDGGGVELPIIAGWGVNPTVESFFTYVTQNTGLVQIGFASTMPLVPARELVPMPGNATMSPEFSRPDILWAAALTHNAKTYLYDVEYSDGGI